VIVSLPIKEIEQVYIEDVAVGSEIPPHTVSFDVVKMAMFASVSGDFFPSHYDNKWAVERSRYPAAIAHGLHVTSHLSQLLTNWVGPQGALKRLSSQNRALTFDGDTVVMRGRVIKKYAEEGGHYVDCNVWGEKQDGTVVVEGTATVILPVAVDITSSTA